MCKVDEMKMDKEKTLIIAVAHQKGGTGKTTTVCNLAACFGMAGDGLRVAVIDLDAQGTATSHLNGASYFSSGSYQVIVGTKSVSEVALPTGIKNCFIVPSTNSLVLCEMDPVVRSLSFNEVREHMLSKADEFDVLIVDCPSGLGIISTMAIAIADLVVMPTPPLAFTEEPLRATVAYIDDLQKDANSRAAIVLTMYEPKIKSQERLVRKICDEWGEMVVDVKIPFEDLVEEAVENNAVIVEFDKRSATAMAYIKLTENLGERLGLKLDFSKLAVNSLGTDLVHGLGKLIEPQTDIHPSVSQKEEKDYIEEPPTPAAMPVEPPAALSVTHEGGECIIPVEGMGTPDEVQPASTVSGKPKKNLFQKSPGKLKVKSPFGDAEKLPEDPGKIHVPEDIHTPEPTSNKINIFRLMCRIVAYTILILVFIVVSIFIP